jgi:tetratricopeptide (TPR) repeat protein
MTADAVERLGLLNIRAIHTPTTADYASTALLLGMAQRYSPDDLSLIRRRGEAAWGAGDKDLLMELTSQAIKLDSTNTVAQLRLISSRLSEFQTVEERLSRIEAFLGPKGSSLDASIRSRLALDAALLYRERGDDVKFVEKLKQATQLDSSNKEAAILAMNYYTSRSSDPMGTLEMLTNLLFADPIDPNVHYELATHLASLGAFNEARRFHGVYTSILRKDGSSINYNLTVRGREGRRGGGAQGALHQTQRCGP